ncbi:MAG: cytochrome c oxidase subunit II [Thermoflexus sp.]|jgi:cytochrome c oxidase subunit 2|nr:cytochrome c oxidase subunit II [Thermoflexus sp.]MDT7948678.1 cytochrome c oxidase subunit II [Thermoflexus sp.]
MKDALPVLLLWLILTVLGEILALRVPLPPAMAEQAHVADEAFRYLWIIGTPVFTFVLSVLLYGLLRFRAAGDPPEDGPPVFTHTPGATTWLAVTALLALSLVVYPGWQGLRVLLATCLLPGAADEGTLKVQVQAAQWSWTFSYPQYGVQVKDRLVLPVGRPVRFEITSKDVIHSFWIPAFRMKLDAVPGRTYTLVLTPDRLGRTAEEPTLRVQCAELCGAGHTIMAASVEVVLPEQFQRWIEEQRAKQSTK